MNYLKFAGLFLIASSLTACSTSQKTVPDAQSTSEQTAILAGAGAVVGGTIGAVASSNAIAGAAAGGVIGGVAGALVGHFKDNPSSLAKKIDAQGIQVVAIGQTLKLIVFSDKCFEFATSTITKSCQNALKDVGALIKETGNVPVRVDGYTDNLFPPTRAKDLTQQQAEAIVAFLWAHGIPHERMIATGHGDSDPIATNYTPKGQSLNRRVEITLG